MPQVQAVLGNILRFRSLLAGDTSNCAEVRVNRDRSTAQALAKQHCRAFTIHTWGVCFSYLPLKLEPCFLA